MILKTDTKKLFELIKAFYNLTGIKTAVYNTDFAEIMAYPEDNGDFCKLMHQSELSCRGCDRSAAEMCRKCANGNDLLIQKCHAGLTEVASPLTEGNTVIGYIIFGQITNEKNRDFFVNDVIKKCEKYGFSQDELCLHIKKIPYYSDEQISDASKIINALASYIILEHIAFAEEMPLIYSIKEYISDNLSSSLSISELTKCFSLSKAELYRIAKPHMPDGIAGYIKKQRMDKAAELLRHTSKPVWQIAEETGFSDVNYFLRVFKKYYGIPAGKYRKNTD